MTVRRLSQLAILGLAIGFAPGAALASDHVDGDVTKGHPISDLSDLYAFPTPNKPGFLTLVLNVHPFALEKNHFSEKVNYRFVLREASTDLAQRTASTDASSERILRLTFDDRADPHTMTCAGGGLNKTVVFNQTDASGERLRLFAGHRADSFFFAAKWAQITAAKGVIAPAKEGGKDSMKGLNTLSVVVEVDVDALFGKDVSLLAVVAESINAKTGARLDRVGRPEVTNVTLVAHEGDADLRDGFNARSPFSQAHQARNEVRARVVKNIGYYDALDQKTDWTAAEAKRYAALIANDYLLVDVSKPAGETGYFTLESALLAGKPHTTAGGRLLTDDIMDTVFTKLINNAKGERMSDGVDEPSAAPTAAFPYLAKPDHRLRSSLKAHVIRKISGVPGKAYTKHKDEHPKPGIIDRIKGHLHGKLGHEHPKK